MIKIGGEKEKDLPRMEEKLFVLIKEKNLIGRRCDRHVAFIFFLANKNIFEHTFEKFRRVACQGKKKINSSA